MKGSPRSHAEVASQRHRNRRWFAFAFAIVWMHVPLSKTYADCFTGYTLSKVVDSATAGFTGANFSGLPSSGAIGLYLNNAGQIAFVSKQGASAPSLSVWQSGSTTSLASLSGSQFVPGFNDQGAALVGDFVNFGPSEFDFYAGTSLPLTKLNASPLNYDGASAAMNNNGDVFLPVFASGTIVKLSGGAVTTFATTGAPFVVYIHANNSGQLAFLQGINGSLAKVSAGTTSIIDGKSIPLQVNLVGGGTLALSFPVTQVGTGTFGFNDNGTAAFVGRVGYVPAFGSDHGRGVFVGSGESLSRIADSINTFEGGTHAYLAFSGQVDINNSGMVAFSANSGFEFGAKFGIYTGANPLRDKVIKEGDPLDGSTVTAIGNFDLNNAGQIAFTATLANGRKGVYLATPDGTPTAWQSAGSYGVSIGTALAGITTASTDGLLSPASIKAGKNVSGTDTSVLTRWRLRNGEELNSAPTHVHLLSDVLDLFGMSNDGVTGHTDPFALQIGYSAAGWTTQFENQVAASAQLRLGYLLEDCLGDSQWVNAVDGNFGHGTAYTNFQGSWDLFSTTYHVTDDNLGDFLGSWGVDTTNHQVWAVLDHNSEYAALPEPSTFILGGLGAVGMFAVGRRRRTLPQAWVSKLVQLNIPQ